VVAGAPPRYAFRDSNSLSSQDGPADLRWRAYALNWDQEVGWDGLGDMPAEARARLDEKVRQARLKGRTLRFWGSPDKPSVWDAQLQAGVDYLGTDRLEPLKAHVTKRCEET
jgi:hypothetical protein